MTKGEETRQRIITQAAPVFNTRGYMGCSLADLMEATGLEKGGIYRHFASKEELAAEAFKYALAQNVKVRTAHLAELPTALAKLRATVEHFCTKPSAIPGGCPLMNTAIEADDTNPQLRALALEGIHAWRTRLVRIIDDGRKSGELPRTLKSTALANTIISTLEGALMISRLERNRTALTDAQAALLRLIDSHVAR